MEGLSFIHKAVLPTLNPLQWQLMSSARIFTMTHTSVSQASKLYDMWTSDYRIPQTVRILRVGPHTLKLSRLRNTDLYFFVLQPSV